MDEATRVEIHGTADRQDESRLLREIARGEPGALEALFRMHRKGILAAAFAAVRNDRLAKDILQETMLYIWRHAADYRYDRNPKAWIYTIVRHQSVDLIRRNRGWVSIETFEETLLPKALTTEPEPDLEMSLREGIGRLDPLEAQVFVLKAVAGLGHAEIASALGLSYRSTHYRYRCAIRELKRLLAE